ncbi:serine hydrolase domain-containing protein [Thermoactinospora rubra]|uniref:serine hydrolase domain-containing protein n=1 Tax=Thermoactinospora rubra TaxID=1088767 RepID=UPI000A107745|nr:serine hydrolase domain-containing protein [Thermoactinospora rubra]
MSDLHKSIQAAIDELVDSGVERGVQVAVYRRGELVVDAVAGVADPATGLPFTSGTPVYVTSTGKGVSAAVVHVLAAKGVLDYDTPIASLWPEFAVHGKDKATVRHALTHQVGVPGVPVDTTPEDLVDYDGMCATIAAAKPWWEPGTKMGYHPQTYMYIVAEIVRRATGKPISQVLREEITGPLGVEDEVYFAVPASELGRVARIEDPATPMEMPPEMMAQIPFFRVVDGFTAAPMRAMPDAAFSNRPDVLTSEIGATMTARGLAKVYDALMHGLIPAERLREVTSPQVSGLDEVAGMEATWGLGYSLRFPLERDTMFGMAGSGGTAGFADTATGVSVAVTKNRISAGEFTTVQRIASLVFERSQSR